MTAIRPVVYTATATDVANGYTPPIPVDFNRMNGQYGLQYLTSGGGAGSGAVQLSLDNPFTPPTGGMTWSNITLTSNRAFINQAVTAFRVQTPALGDVLTVVAQGGSPAG